MKRLTEVLNQNASANYLISRRIPVSLDVQMESLDVLIEVHQGLLAEFFSYRHSLDEGYEPPEDEPLFSFLNLKEEIARRLLKECGFCEWNCRVDRQGMKTGNCELLEEAPVYRYGTEPEPLSEISPAFAIYFSGCNFRNGFCDSLGVPTSSNIGSYLLPDSFSLEVREAYDRGAKCLKFTGGEPTLHLHYIFSLLSFCQWNLPVALHTNLYTTPLATSLLEGVLDVLLVDIKFGTDACAQSLGRVERYMSILQRNLKSYRSAPLYIRHTVIPGHVSCCTRPWLEWLAHQENPPAIQVLFHYTPPTVPTEVPELNRFLTPEEKEEVNSLLHKFFGISASSSSRG